MRASILNPQWHTGAEEKKPRSWKRKQFVKYCFRRWQTTRIRDPGFRRFKERGKYLNFAKYNFEISIVNYQTYDNNSLFIRSFIFGQIKWNKTTKKKNICTRILDSDYIKRYFKGLSLLISKGKTCLYEEAKEISRWRRSRENSCSN